MRVAVIDIGTNSTRLLVADVSAGGRVAEVARRSTVTRLGAGVDRTGELAGEAIDRVHAVLEDYRSLVDAHGAEREATLLTSAARDAHNGPAFAERVRTRHRLDPRIISGAEEARLTFIGATHDRPDPGGPLVVVDVGGGSTELVVGRGASVSFHVSTQVGVVRHGERHLHHDPPRPDELQALARDVGTTFEQAVPPGTRDVVAGVAVAGTATQAAAIELALEPYDPTRVHGHRLTAAGVELLVARLATMAEAERRAVAGLDPERAPVIVPGVVILLEAMSVLGLDEVEVSEHDILHGAALALASGG